MIDIQTAALLTAWTIALVSAIRKMEPRIDGLWVLLAAALCASVSSAAYCAPDWPNALRLAAMAWIGAVGGVQFLDRVLDRTAMR
jgi:hypothetical protein